MKIAVVGTCPSNDQWLLIQPMILEPKELGRPRTEPRRILDAVLYVVESEIQWRLLPFDFPPWKTVYQIFRRWIRDHVWESINVRQRTQVRAAAGKRSRPTAAILDSQKREI